MSHFTVLVLTKPGQSLDDQLAPFDEDIQVEPYKDRIGGVPTDYWSFGPLNEKGLLGPDPTWRELVDAHTARYGDEEKLGLDEEGPYAWSTYSPQSHWDWWTIGGRWPSQLLRKNGNEVNQARKDELDLPGMRTAAREKAIADRRKIVAIVGQDNADAHLTWEQTLEKFAVKVDDKVTNIDDVRTAYQTQPSITLYKASLGERDQMFFLGETVDEMLSQSEEQVARMAEAGAIPGWATLDTQGRWLEKGRMGWWAMNDATKDSTIGYFEVANQLIDDAPGDTLFTIVDAHI